MTTVKSHKLIQINLHNLGVQTNNQSGSVSKSLNHVRVGGTGCGYCDYGSYTSLSKRFSYSLVIEIICRYYVVGGVGVMNEVVTAHDRSYKKLHMFLFNQNFRSHKYLDN